jgi:copper chaperone NosL
MIRTRPIHRVATAVVVLAAGAACGVETGPPELVLDRAACARCGMLISEPRFAAAYRSGNRTAVFDDIGCLLDALEEAELPTGATAEEAATGTGGRAAVWFLDAEQRWLPEEEAVFVISAELETPMGGGIQAFAGRDAAQEVASGTGGSMVESLDQLRASRRAARASGGRS